MVLVVATQRNHKGFVWLVPRQKKKKKRKTRNFVWFCLGLGRKQKEATRVAFGCLGRGKKKRKERKRD